MLDDNGNMQRTEGVTVKISDQRAGPGSEIPDNIDELLNDAQKNALKILGGRGWSIAFVRRPKHLPPIVVVCSENEEYGVLLDTGEVDFPSDLRVRGRVDSRMNTAGDYRGSCRTD